MTLRALFDGLDDWLNESHRHGAWVAAGAHGMIAVLTVAELLDAIPRLRRRARPVLLVGAIGWHLLSAYRHRRAAR